MLIRNAARLGAVAGLAAMTAFPVLADPSGRDGGRDPMCRMQGKPARLEVTGQGRAQVAPDMATITLGVTTQAETAAAAMSENSTRQNAVIEAVRGHGIESADIQTTGLSLSPMMDYSQNGQAPRVTGYQAQNLITVRVTDLANLGAVLDGIVGAGANEMQGLVFGREDSQQAQDDARIAAVQDASHRAGVLAAAAGLQLGPVLSMSEGGVATPPRPMMRAMAAEADSSVPVEAGSVAMESTVLMSFALLSEPNPDCAPRRGGEPEQAPEAPATE